MNTLHVILAIIVIGYFTGSFEGISKPERLLCIVAAVLLFNQYSKKEGFETADDNKYNF
jgi:hypothetical protein